MVLAADLTGSGSASAGAGEALPVADFHRFLRVSHTLGSLLREFLEGRFLAQVCPHPLTRVQFCFLKLVTLNPDLPVGEVGRCLGVTAAASTKAVDRLVGFGLVDRHPCPDDRRVTRLQATADGARLVRDYERVKAARLAPVVAALGDRQRRELCDLIEAVCVGLIEREALPETTCLRCAGYFQANCAIARQGGECALEVGRDRDGGMT